MSLTSRYQASSSVMLDAPAVQDADWNGATFDSRPYKGGLCFIWISAGHGSSTVDAKLQDSPNGSSWTDVTDGDFTQGTTAETAYHLTVSSANVDRYLRIVYDHTGGGSIAMASSVMAQVTGA